MRDRGADRELRLFVGLRPPPDVAERLLDAVRALALPPHRLVPAAQVHLTLQFVGGVPGSRLDETIESVHHAAHGIAAFSLTPGRLIALPERGHRRLVAAETDLPAPLRELKRRLASRLARDPRRDSADRFLPHLTLLRFRAPTPLALEAPLDAPAFDVAEIEIVRSILHAGGAEHRVFGRVALASPA